ncbi:hypothetical protein BC827DRAFT_677170 [Russula dissimulans]|nr:hypothetical protein BC827DRAFT_677170 [Russula dissimulans]
MPAGSPRHAPHGSTRPPTHVPAGAAPRSNSVLTRTHASCRAPETETETGGVAVFSPIRYRRSYPLWHARCAARPVPCPGLAWVGPLAGLATPRETNSGGLSAGRNFEQRTYTPIHACVLIHYSRETWVSCEWKMEWGTS